MNMLSKSKYFNSIKISQNSLKGNPYSFNFSYKNEEHHRKGDSSQFSYDFNKFNAPNILLDKESKKEIEKSFGKVIERYEKKKKEDFETKKSEIESKMKTHYKYSGSDYIPNNYMENKDRENKFDNYDEKRNEG